MTEIEALRARMREAAEKAKPALARYALGEPERGDEDALNAFDEAVTIDAILALDAEITRLRDDLDRGTRERDGWRASTRILSEQAHDNAVLLLSAQARAEAAEAALAKRDEEVARLRASMKIAVDWAEALKFFADSGTSLAPALAQLREALSKEPTNAER